MSRRFASRNAFSLIELLVVILIIVLLMAILLPALQTARKSARRAVCESNMRQFGVAYHTYAADFKDYISVPNAPNTFPPGWSLLQLASPTHFQLYDASNRMIEIIQAKTGITLLKFTVSGGGSHSPMEQHAHLSLIDYMGDHLPMASSACPEDQARLSWQKNPRGISSGPFSPRKKELYEGATWTTWLPFSSSYQLSPSAYLPDIASFATYNFYDQNSQAHDLYTDNGGSKNVSHEVLRKMFEVSMPAQKVAMYDTQQRHYGRKDLFFGYENARIPLLMWDSSVSVRKAGDMNKGWQRTKMRNTKPQQLTYKPDLAYESPTPSGADGELTTGAFYRWTRGGFKGIDFGGPELDTSRW